MKNKEYHVLGVMSGTSLDGIDLCYVRFNCNREWSFEIIESETIAYPSSWRTRLNDAINEESKNIETLNKDYTTYLGEIIGNFIKAKKLKKVDAVCSHGHTIFHEPENRYTLQIGNLPELASLIGTKVVCDFRVQDVKLGGQGAPLVPIGDKLLFHNYDFCINLGGFANVSFDRSGKRVAYDICPANIVLNHYVRKTGKDFDNNGAIAASGNINEDLLERLNSLAFYALDAPKSLGLEWVIQYIYPLIDDFQLAINDILRTFVEHIAVQISKATRYNDKAHVLVTGGGVFNNFLMARISANTANTIVIPDSDIIAYKEAVIFGLLGVLKIRNEHNCLSSVTGAKHDHSSGIIFLP